MSDIVSVDAKKALQNITTAMTHGTVAEITDLLDTMQRQSPETLLFCLNGKTYRNETLLQQGTVYGEVEYLGIDNSNTAIGILRNRISKTQDVTKQDEFSQIIEKMQQMGGVEKGIFSDFGEMGHTNIQFPEQEQKKKNPDIETKYKIEKVTHSSPTKKATSTSPSFTKSLSRIFSPQR